MHYKRFAPLLLVLVLAACGGATPGATSKPGGGGDSPTSKPAGQVDCAALATAAEQLIAVQFLARLNTPDAIESIKSKAIGNLDLDTFLTAMKTLHALDGYSSILGDPKAALDFYEKAGKAAQVLFATEPMTQGAIETYNQNVGTVADFLGHQAAIAGALDAAGC
jgi:hypothetical protein